MVNERCFVGMATQTYATDMQALQTPNVQQVSQNNQTVVVQSGQQGQPSLHQQSKSATIIQPSQAHSGQQFIVTIAGDATNEQVQEAVQLSQQQSSGQVVYQEQYVDGSPDPTVYAASNGTMYDYGQSALYTPVSGTYYQTSSSSQMNSHNPHMGNLQGQILTHQGGTYLVQGGAMDGEGHPLTHTTRASPATDPNSQRNSHFDVKCWQREVQWLIDNYETAEGVSLPRSTLYNHYLRHCQEQKIDPMNPASFGKLIRSVFLGLRTRRLGTRGNSKYHYYGIRIKATSPLNQFTDDQTMAMRQQPLNQGKRFKSAITHAGDSQDSQDGQNSKEHIHQQFLGDASGAIPSFEEIEMNGEPLPEGITQDDLNEFESLYKEHCEAILDIVVNLQFSLIEALWQSFWRNSTDPTSSSEAASIEKALPKDRLLVMCKMEQVQVYVRRSDYSFYQALVEVLIPDVLRPIPSSLTQAIRNFAKSLEGWLRNSMTGIPDEMLKTKVGAISAFAQTLRRYTSLNHLAQAARAVLQNTTQISQMLTDLNRVDFANVQEQASWVCQCDDAVVHQLEQDFKKTLQEQNNLEQWADWLEGVVNQVLQPHEGNPNFPKAARQFLLKWSFYSSMVIRDLTLRSAASFGSFHLIRLLYDEYMFYLVEHKVASATGETPIAVMGEFIDLSSVINLGSMDSDPASAGTPLLTSAPVLTPLKTVSASAMVNSIATPTLIKQSINGQASTTMSTPSSKPVVVTPVSVNHTGSMVNAHFNSQGQVVTTPHSVTQVVGTHMLVNNPSIVSGGQQTKTIVVVPVSASTAGSGDAQPAIKKLKT